MPNGGRIDFTVGLKTDKSSINQLKNVLQSVQDKLDTAPDKLTPELKNAAAAARELQSILNSSWNEKLGQLNLDKVNKGIKDAYGSFQKFSEALSKGGQQGKEIFNSWSSEILNTNLQISQGSKLLNDMADTFGKTVKYGIASSVFNNMKSSIEQAFYFAKDLDLSLTNIRIVTGDSADQMERFARTANGAAKELGRSTLDYTKAALTFYQQGLGDEDVEARTKAVMMAQNITGAGTEMADYLTSVWNGFKVTADQTIEYVDKLAAVADSSASDMSQLAIGMSKVASAANVVGVDVDQLSAQIATIIATTRQAPESIGTSLKTIYARINDIKAGSDEAEVSLGKYSGAMAALGFNVFDTNGKLRDTGDVIEDVGNGWNRLTKEQQIYLAQMMGGTRQYSRLISLFDNWDMYTEMLNVSLDSQGTLLEKNDRYMESVKAHMEQLNAETERTYQILSDTGAINNIVDALNEALTIFNDFIEGLGGGVNVLVNFGSQFVNLFSNQIGKSINEQINNFQMFIANINATKLKQNVIDAIKVDAKSQGVSLSEEAVRKQAAIAERLLGVRKNITQQQYNEITVQQRKVGILQTQIEELQKKAEIYAKSLNYEGMDSSSNYTNFLARQQESLKLLQSSYDLTKKSKTQKYETLQIEQAIAKVKLANNNLDGNRKITQQDINRLEELRAKLTGDEKQDKQYLVEIEKIINKYLSQQKGLVEQINGALKNRKLIQDKTAQQAASERLAKAELQRLERQKAISAAVRATSSVIQGLSSLIGGINTSLDETVSAAERANGMFSAISGTIAAGFNAFLPGSGFIVQGIAGVVKESLEFFGIWDDIVDNFKTAKQKLDEIKQVQKQSLSNAQDYNNARKEVASFAQEWQELSKKSGHFSEEEQERYNVLAEKLSKYNSDIISGYDDQYNAIVTKNNAIQDTLKLLEKEYEQNQKILYSNGAIRGDVAYTNAQEEEKSSKAEQNQVADWGSGTDLAGITPDSFQTLLSQLEAGKEETIRNFISSLYITDDVKQQLNNALTSLEYTMGHATYQQMSDTMQTIKTYYDTIQEVIQNNPYNDFGDLKSFIEQDIQPLIDAYAEVTEDAKTRVQIAEKTAALDFPVPGQIILNNIRWGTVDKQGTHYQGHKQYQQLKASFGEYWEDIGQGLVQTAVSNFIQPMNYGQGGIKNDQDVYQAVENFLKEVLKSVDVQNFVDLFNQREKLLQHAADYSNKELHQKLLEIGQNFIDNSQTVADELLKGDEEGLVGSLLSFLLGGNDFTFDGSKINSFMTEGEQYIQDRIQDFQEAIFQTKGEFSYGTLFNQMFEYAKSLSNDQLPEFFSGIDQIALSQVNNFSDVLRLLKEIKTQSEEMINDLPFGDKISIFDKISKDKDVDSIKNGRAFLDYYFARDPKLLEIAAKQDAGYYSDPFLEALKEDMIADQAQIVSKAQQQVKSKQSRVDYFTSLKEEQEASLAQVKKGSEEQAAIQKKLETTTKNLTDATKELGSAKAQLVTQQSNLNKFTQKANSQEKTQLEISKQRYELEKERYNTQLSAYQKLKEGKSFSELSKEEAEEMSRLQVQNPLLAGLQAGTPEYMAIVDQIFAKEQQNYDLAKSRTTSLIQQEITRLETSLQDAKTQKEIQSITEQIIALQTLKNTLRHDSLDILEEQAKERKTQLEIAQQQYNTQKNAYNTQLSAYQKLKEGKSFNELTQDEATEVVKVQVENPKLKDLTWGTDAYKKAWDQIFAKQQQNYQIAKKRTIALLQQDKQRLEIELQEATTKEEVDRISGQINETDIAINTLRHDSLNTLEDQTKELKTQLDLLRQKKTQQEKSQSAAVSAYGKLSSGQDISELNDDQYVQVRKTEDQNPQLKFLGETQGRNSRQYLSLLKQITNENVFQFNVTKRHLILENQKQQQIAKQQSNEEQLNRLIEQRYLLERSQLDIIKDRYENTSQMIEDFQGLATKLDQGQDLSGQQWANLNQIFDKLIQKYPQVANSAELLKSTWLSGTDQYKQALIEVQNALQNLSIDQAVQNIQKEFEDIKVTVDDSQVSSWVDQIEDFLEADHELTIRLDESIHNDIEKFQNEMDDIYKAASKIGQNFIVAPEDIAQVMEVFPGIEQGMVRLEDGSRQLNATVVENALGAAQGEVQASANAVKEKLQQEIQYLTFKKEQYHIAAEAAARLASDQVGVSEDASADQQIISQALQKVKQRDAQLTTNKINSQQKKVVDNAAQNGQAGVKTAAQTVKGIYSNFANGFDAIVNKAYNAFTQIYNNMQRLGNNQAPVAEVIDVTKSATSSLNLTYGEGVTQNVGVALQSDDGTSLADRAANGETLTKEDYQRLYDYLTAEEKNADQMISRARAGIQAIDAGFQKFLNGLNNVKRGQGIEGKKPEKEEKPKEEKEKEPAKPDQMDLLDKQVDIYHDINIQLDKIQRNLTKIEQKQEKLTGYRLVNNLQKQLDLLNKQIAAQKQKIALAEGQAATLRATLEGQGVQFLKNGQIGNYNEILQAHERYVNDLISYYNSLSKEEQEYIKDTVEQAKKDFEKFQKNIQEYDEIINKTIPDLRDNIRDELQKQVQIKISKMKIGVQASVNLAKLRQDYHKFLKEVKYQIRDDDILGQTKYLFGDMKAHFQKNGHNEILNLANHAAFVRGQIESINKTGTSSTYGSNKTQALQDLQKDTEDLKSALQDVVEKAKQIKQQFIDSIDQLVEGFAKQEKYYNLITDQLNHDAKMVELLYGQHAYDRMNMIYQTQYEYDKKHLAALANQKEIYKTQMQKWQERQAAVSRESNEWYEYQTYIDKYEQAWLDTNSRLNAAFQSSLENITAKYKNSVDQIFYDINMKFTDGKGLQFVQDEWEMIQEEDKRHLDAVNSKYEIEKLANRYDQELDNTRLSIKAQKELNALKENQLEYLQSIDKLTQYDVDRANKLLDIELKRLALDEARDNKTKLRLRRDSQGNYSYQYVADDNDINGKMQDLRDAQNELYNLTKNENIQSHTRSLQDMIEWERLATQAAIKYKDQQGVLKQYLLMLEQHYGARMEDSLREQTKTRIQLAQEAFSAITETDDWSYHNVFGTDGKISKYYNQSHKSVEAWMADDQKTISEKLGALAGSDGPYAANAQAWYSMVNGGSDFTGMVPTWTSGVQAMEEAIGKTGDKGFRGVISQANTQIETSLAKLQKEILGIEKQGTGGEGGLFKTIGTQLGEVIDTIGSQGNKDTLLGKNALLIESYKQINLQMGQMIENLETWTKNHQPVIDTGIAEVEESMGTLAHEWHKDNNAGNKELQSNYTIPDPVNFTGGSTSGELIVHQSSKSNDGSIVIDLGPQNSLEVPDEKKITLKNTLGTPVKKVNFLSRYGTGGYTGDWPEEEGKLAILDSKELVLNKLDTENILNAVNITRGISDMLSKIGNYDISGAVARVASASTTPDQNVYITAHFPAVTDHHEIELALESLTSRASQYIHSNLR